MKGSKLLVKYLSYKDIKLVENITLILCKTRKDYVRYTRTFMAGFDKPRNKFFMYFLNCFDRKYQMFLVKKESDVIGCFALRIKGPKTIYLYDFTVLSQYRGKGYSRDIINLIYELALKRNKNKLCLYVRKTNDTALSLYKSEGFVEYLKNTHL